MNMPSQQGYVLIIILLFGLIVSMLMCSLMQATLMQYKMIGNQTIQAQLALTAQNTLARVQRDLAAGRSARYASPVLTDSDFWQDSWWRAHARAFNAKDAQIDLVSERTAQLPCARLIGGNTPGVDYFRISVRVRDRALRAQAIVQAVLSAKSSQPLTCEDGRIIPMDQRILSWLEL
jgi:Tfp pilus assembly protein PilX